MTEGGSTGTPTYRQTVMQKQKAQEGFTIIGSEARKDRGGTSRGRTSQGNKVSKPNPEMPGIVTNGQENPETRSEAGQTGSAPIITPSEGENTRKEGKGSPENENKLEASNPSPNNTSQGVCKPKKKDTLRMVLSDPNIQAYREHMIEHAIICKFMGLWPTERALCQWIKQHWRPKGDVKLHLGAKGFFTVVFTNLEDKDKVFNGGPYFFSSAGLYMRPWKANFVPEK